jgi:hypothetical protein
VGTSGMENPTSPSPKARWVAKGGDDDDESEGKAALVAIFNQDRGLGCVCM